jgi:hypothetical protein
VFNVFNTNAPFAYFQNVGPNYLQPASLISARFAKVSATFDF